MSCNCNNYKDVQITGLCNPDYIDFDLDINPYWTQISIPENLLVPNEKPPIEELYSVNISVQIISKKVITTPRSGGVDSDPPADNNEGKKLTGRKLLIEGFLCQTVSYIAAVADQSMHSVQFSVPFSAFIVVPKEIDGVDTKDINFDINACIEDVFIISVCPTQIFKNVTLLLQATPVPSENCINECC